jgi:hypothetical protein
MRIHPSDEELKSAKFIRAMTMSHDAEYTLAVQLLLSADFALAHQGRSIYARLKFRDAK